MAQKKLFLNSLIRPIIVVRLLGEKNRILEQKNSLERKLRLGCGNADICWEEKSETLKNLSALLKEIHWAFIKIIFGRYGLCEKCETPLFWNTLMKKPLTKFCPYC